LRELAVYASVLTGRARRVGGELSISCILSYRLVAIVLGERGTFFQVRALSGTSVLDALIGVVCGVAGNTCAGRVDQWQNFTYGTGPTFRQSKLATIALRKLAIYASVLTGRARRVGGELSISFILSYRLVAIILGGRGPFVKRGSSSQETESQREESD